MAKKNRVRTYCQVCKKTTVHEIRSTDGEEQPVCLVCAGPQLSERQKADLTIEAERMRIFMNPPNFPSVGL
jgi:hypothetical protein